MKFNEITVEYFENSLNRISDMGYARIGLHNLIRRLKLGYRDNRTFFVTQTLIPENHLSYEDAVIKVNEIMASGDFPDYNSEELLNIMKLMMKESEYTMTPDAEKAVMEIFEMAQYTENFGNGRFARNVLEQAEMRQATRLMKQGFCNAEDKETLFRLEKDDFNLPALMPKEEHKRSIGFVS